MKSKFPSLFLSAFSLVFASSCSTGNFLATFSPDQKTDSDGWSEIATSGEKAPTVLNPKKDKDSGKAMDNLLGDDLPRIDDALTLEQCLEKAMEQNRKRPASRAALAVAEAQHQQALAAYWPQVTLQGSADLRSDDPNFLFPATDFNLPATSVAVPAQQFLYPATTINTPPSGMTLPLGPGGAPVTVPIPSQSISVPAQTINVPAQNFQVDSQTFHLPEQDVQVMDRRTVGGQADVRWLLWNGGWRRALNDQAKAGVSAAKEEARRTDLEIVYDVKRMYHGAVLAGLLERIGKDTLERMDATLDLTEKLYQGGSMQVNKTDYLRNKVLVDGLRSLVARLEENRQLARAALVNSMGLSWKSEIRPATTQLDLAPLKGDLDQMVAETYEFSPDWRRLEAGLNAAEAKIREEKAGYLPKVAFLGNIHAVDTPYEGGFATDSNLNAWNVGVGVELPLFDGFLTKGRIDEAKARLAELKAQKVLLREGLALQVKAYLIQLNSMQKQEGSNLAASKSAEENRNLTEKAYRSDLIEADKVFSAQIMEAITEARKAKLRFDHGVTKSQLDLLIGKDVLGRLGLAETRGA